MDKQYSAAGNIAGRSEDLFRSYSTYLREANRRAGMRNQEWENQYAATVIDSTRNILKLKAHTFVN